MKRFLVGMVALVCCVSQTHAALIAGWNFNDSNTTVDYGAGSLSSTFPPANQSYTAGTTLNAVSGDAAGQAYTLTNNVNNGQTVTFEVSTAGLEDLILTFAARRSSTGFNGNQIAYSTNGGGSFTDFGSPYTLAAPDVFEIQTFDFSSIPALDNNAGVQIRITLNGATGSAGSHRLDNVQFNAVPEPTALALLLIGGLAIHRRRR